MLENAQFLDSFGWNVLPVKPGEKAPYVEWRKYTIERTTEALAGWFNGQQSNYWIACGGVSGVFVLDIDSPEADAWWREVVGLGDAMDDTVAVRTSKGTHYYFSVPLGDKTPGWAVHDEARSIDFDVRGAGGGVVAPPSVHESGFVYEWIRSPADWSMVPAPPEVLSRKGLEAKLGVKGEQTVPGIDSNTRSMLSSLLSKPPSAGGRNEWLARVAGHYAKQHRGQQDLYYVQCGIANKMMKQPLDAGEFDKTVGSIWQSEHANHGEDERGLSNDTGWLMSGDDRILVQIREGKGSDAALSMAEFANFDLKVVGIMESQEGAITYDCQMKTKRGDEYDVVLPGTTMGTPAQLHAWLAGYGVSCARPDGIYPVSPSDHTRILRYVAHQDAPRSRTVPALGWDDATDGFLTFEGVIRADGPHPFSGVRPDPEIRRSQRIDCHYGFEGGEQRAREILNEVCTYHDDEIVSVFGSWWAACLLKPQLTRHTSLFPIMALEAASGAGKTNGFFSLMIQLNGSVKGATQSTVASARDSMSGHRSGIVWIDDMDSLGRIEELLRAATSGETITKKGMDNKTNVNIPLVSPVVVSGEQLGLDSQKALMDRVVRLAPGKPDRRMSQKPGREGKPQWEDVVELTSAYPLASNGLAVVAGALVQMALGLETGAIERLRSARTELKRGHSGRQAEKLSILVAGAWVLDRMLGVDVHEKRVMEWIETPEAINNSAGEWDNKATVEIVPWALRAFDWPETAIGKPPAFIERESATRDLYAGELVVWVNCAVTADAWRESRHGQITERTDTAAAIRDQMIRCGIEPHTTKAWDTTPGRASRQQARYWPLTGEAAEVVLLRSQG